MYNKQKSLVIKTENWGKINLIFGDFITKNQNAILKVSLVTCNVDGIPTFIQNIDDVVLYLQQNPKKYIFNLNFEIDNVPRPFFASLSADELCLGFSKYSSEGILLTQNEPNTAKRAAKLFFYDVLKILKLPYDQKLQLELEDNTDEREILGEYTYEHLLNSNVFEMLNF